MKTFVRLAPSVLVLLSSLLSPAAFCAQQQRQRHDSAPSAEKLPAASPLYGQSMSVLFPTYMRLPAADARPSAASAAERGGIREEIPERFRERYEAWKSEFLSTETGRRQWEAYARGDGFTLTINVSTDNRQGATTGKFRWDDAGRLTGVTITLGCQLDEGFPDPVYYPVMHSLSWSGVSDIMSGRLLAATKIAHEFGHVNRALNMDGALYRLQNQLMPLYKKIFLSNGHNTRDPRLVKLAGQMGGTSVEIWEDREYWGEANAMLYLRDRLPERNSRCVLFSRIRSTVEAYAEPYAERFRQIAQAEPLPCRW